MVVTSMKNLVFLSLLVGSTVGSVVACDSNDGSKRSLHQTTFLSRLIGSIGQSSVVHSFSKNVQTKIDKAYWQTLLQCGDAQASQKYQDLGSCAQCNLGIPEHHQLPIKKLNPQSPMAPLVGAIAESDAIYVNEEKMDQRTYGSVACTISHEATHVKYHDKAVDQLIELGVFPVAAVGAWAVLKALQIVRLRKTISFVVALGLTSCASFAYHQFMERRADIEGHYATQCSSCVYEHAQNRKRLFEEENSPLRYNGYLWAADLEKIAQDLGDKKCAHHQNNNA